MTALKAFGLAVLVACAWFAGVMVSLAGHEPSPLIHAIILLVPLAACGLIQHRLTRTVPQTPVRKAVQAGAAAILAPILATAIVWLVWVILLGHGE